MTDPLSAFRRLFDRISSAQPEGEANASGPRPEVASDEEGVAGSAGDEPARWEPEHSEISSLPLSPRDRQNAEGHSRHEHDGGDSPSSRLARHARTYLNARAEEALASLLEELSRETVHEMDEAVERIREALSDEMGDVREGVASSQRELSRIGRELVRSGASLEVIQAAVSALGPAIEQMEGSRQAQLMQQLAGERQLREEAERGALDDMLATLDGLEAGMEHGRELVQSLSEVQHRLNDSTVRRWWRAMGEATGVKRPLPEVPVADLEGWMGGLELTHRRLQDALARRGVTPIEAVGKPFNPYLHEAVAVEPCSKEQDGLVLREERRGYRTSDRVLRLTQAVVGQAVQAEVATGGRRARPSAKQPVGDREPQGEGDSAQTGQQREDGDGTTPPSAEGEMQS